MTKDCLSCERMEVSRLLEFSEKRDDSLADVGCFQVAARFETILAEAGCPPALFPRLCPALLGFILQGICQGKMQKEEGSNPLHEHLERRTVWYWLTRIRDFMTGDEAYRARCAFCGYSYQQVGPLLQGVGGAFACHSCLRKVPTRSEAKSQSLTNVDENKIAFASEEAIASRNPYAPSTSILICSFCGQKNELGYWKSALGSYFICQSCVEGGVAMLNAYEAQKREPEKR